MVLIYVQLKLFVPWRNNMCKEYKITKGLPDKNW